MNRRVVITACSAITPIGYGKADKRQIQQMVKLLLHMDAIARPDDAADALAIALTHAATGPACCQFRMK